MKHSIISLNNLSTYTVFTKHLQNETGKTLLGFSAKIQTTSSNGIAKKYVWKRTALEIFYERELSQKKRGIKIDK